MKPLSRLAWSGVVLFLGMQAWAQGYHGQVMDPRTGIVLNADEVGQRLSTAQILALGEKHATSEVQAAQAEAFTLALIHLPARSESVLGWEFLDYLDQERIESFWFEVLLGRKSVLDFLEKFQGQGKSLTYQPILESARRERSQLVGVNLPRTLKAPIVEKGLSGLDPKYLPSGFAMGSAHYRARFFSVFKEGKPDLSDEKIENYFIAQCVTDDVMASQLVQYAAPFKALVVGSFHSDYFDGVVERLKRRSFDRVLSLRFVDAADYTPSELSALINHTVYGPIADLVWFVNEPRVEPTP